MVATFVHISLPINASHNSSAHTARVASQAAYSVIIVSRRKMVLAMQCRWMCCSCCEDYDILCMGLRLPCRVRQVLCGIA